MKDKPILQAIETKILGPTDYKPTRIRATTASGITIVRSRDQQTDISLEDDSKRVAMELAKTLGWETSWIGGTIKNGNIVWVQVGDV
jgi:hypothetical protein